MMQSPNPISESLVALAMPYLEQPSYAAAALANIIVILSFLHQ